MKINRNFEEPNSEIKFNGKKERKIKGISIPFFSLVLKHLKINFRNKGALLMLFAFPIVLMAIFSVAFNFPTSNPVYNIVIMNLDNIDENGENISNDDILRANSSAILLELFNPESNITDIAGNGADFGNLSINFADTFINHQTHENGSLITQSDALELIKDDKLDALIIIPQNFSENIIGNTWWYSAIGEGINNLPNNISDYNDSGALLDDLVDLFNITLDPLTRIVIESELDGFFESEDYDGLLDFFEYSNNTIFDIPKLCITTSDDPIEKQIVSLVFDQIVNQMVLSYNNISSPVINFDAGESADLTLFDRAVPTVVIMGVMVSLSLSAVVLSKERNIRMLNRLETTPISKAKHLLSFGTGQFILSIIQIVMLMLCIVLFGSFIHPQARWDYIFIILASFSISCIGIGLIIASVIKDYNSAIMVSTLLTVFFSVLEGWFLPLGIVEKLVPNSYASDSLFQILVMGLEITSCIEELFVILMYGGISLLIGVILFSKRSQF
ncbi:MAG: ABC transporter permease [archaeon]|nr:ABC transporter permease [archaeon]